MHGVSGAVGLDTHHRLGMGTLWLGTEPRSSSESDLKAWMFDMAFGAPGGTAYDVGIKGPKRDHAVATRPRAWRRCLPLRG